MSRVIRRVFRGLLVGVLTCLPALAAGQVTTGVVSGAVHDEQGGVIPGATVVLISETRDTRSVPVRSRYHSSMLAPSTTGAKRSRTAAISRLFFEQAPRGTGTHSASGHSLSAREIGIAERTPN